MIKSIKIEKFKSILKYELACGHLNIYTGINGSGKSTFLQSLLLLRQSYIFGSLLKKPSSLILNNSEGLINIGTYKDVLCRLSPKKEEKISFSVSFDSTVLNFVSDMYSIDNRDLNILKGITKGSITKLKHESLFNDNFQYLAAERIQPAEDYPRFISSELLGKQGEFTPHFIEKYGARDINIKELSFNKNAVSFSLLNQTNDWMSVISDSIQVNVKENLGTNRIELSYTYKLKDGTPTQNQKPQNVGFGITHTLPIVVSILAAKKGDIIIIENPETHLHPRGQSRIAYLFALAAENGIQLFIETHSDHIINGIRIAVKERSIDKDNVYINYFTKRADFITEIERINMDNEGGLQKWPEGFFDEWDNSLNSLM